MQKNILENEFMKGGISEVICEDVEAKTTFITYLLHKYGITENQEVLFYTFAKRSDYYYRHLLSCISKINKRVLTKYLYPWLGLSHNNTELINRFHFVSAIEKVQQSNLFMIGEKGIAEMDYLDNILEMLEFDTSTIVVIEDFHLLLKNSKYHKKEALRKMSESVQRYGTEFILIHNVDKEDLSVEKRLYVNIIGSKKTKERTKRLSIKEYEKEELQKEQIIEYDKNNYEIERKQTKC